MIGILAEKRDPQARHDVSDSLVVMESLFCSVPVVIGGSPDRREFVTGVIVRIESRR